MNAFPYTGAGSEGMKLRDYFAAKIMQSFVLEFNNDEEWNAWEQAFIAYQIADAMIYARSMVVEGEDDE